MLHKLSLLMTGLVLMMGVAWFGLQQMSVTPVSSEAPPVEAVN